MIYTNNTKKAILIAYNAHMGQYDKMGLPYVLHPIHLAEQMDSEEECIVALLHDVVEDTIVTFDDLEKEFSKEIIDALKLLTHNKEENYFEYVKRIKNNKLAKRVKIEDIKHNSDKTRIEHFTDEDIKRNEKYKKALEILLD